MSVEDTIGRQDRGPERCAVCEKNVENGGGFAHVKHGDGMVPLCCPLCFDTFQKDPQTYIRRLETQRLLREMKPKQA